MSFMSWKLARLVKRPLNGLNRMSNAEDIAAAMTATMVTVAVLAVSINMMLAVQ